MSPTAPRGLAGLGLAFYFHKLYLDTVAPFLHFAVSWTPSQITFAIIGVALGFAAGLARAFADHRTYSAAEAADLRRRAAEERRAAAAPATPRVLSAVRPQRPWPPSSQTSTANSTVQPAPKLAPANYWHSFNRGFNQASSPGSR